MPNKLTVLKLLWNNLLLLKENNTSPDSTFDFLNEDEMIKFLFNEDERYVKLLFLTLESGKLDQVRNLDPEFSKLFTSFYTTSSTKNEDPVMTKPSPKKSASKKKAVKNVKVEDTVEDEVTLEADDTVEDKAGVQLEESHVSDSDVGELSEDSVELESDGDIDSEVDSDGEENALETFYNEYLLEVDNTESKVELGVILNKYSSFCDTNNVEKDNDELEVFLVNKLGKPKGKRKPKFLGVELKA